MKRLIACLLLCRSLSIAAPVVTSPLVVATYDRSTSNALLVTPIFVADQTALYRITGLVTTVVPATAGTVCLNVFWYDGDTGAYENNGPGCPSATLTGYGPNWVYTFYAQKGTPISVNTVLSGVTGTPSYTMHFVLEQF